MKILDIKCLQECIAFKVLIKNKLSNFISFYWPPSQPADQFEDNLELRSDEVGDHNSFLIDFLGDFHVKSENWYKHEKPHTKELI